MTDLSESKPKLKKSGFIIFILAFSAFSVINTEMGVSGILPEITQRYAVSLSTASWLVSGFAVIVAISGPFTPAFMERFNHKIVMVIVLFLFLISNIVSFLTTNFTILFLARIVPAILQPAFFSLAYVVAENLVDKNKRSEAVAKVLMGVSTGFVLGVPVSNFIASQFSLQMSMVFFALTNVIALILVALFVPSIKSVRAEPLLKQLGGLKKRVIPVSFAIVLMLNASVFGFFSFMSVYLLRVTHLMPQLVSVFLLVYGLTNIIGNFIAGRELSNKPKRLLNWIPVMLIITFVILGLVNDEPILVFVLLALLGIIAGAVGNTIQYVVSDALPDSPALANGLFVSLGNIGIVTGTFINGQVLNTFGINRIVIMSAFFAVLSFILIKIQEMMKKN